MRERAIGLLRELTEAHGAPGFEDEVRAIFADEMAETGEISTDGLGSVFCERGEGPRVMVAGHMDEIGFRVQNITPEGFIQFVTLGGWWPHTLLAQRVEISTRDGRKILGVVSSKPPHFLPESERGKVLSIEQMFIDVGAQSDFDLEKNYGVRVGDPVVPLTPFSVMQNEDLLMAKAFDNRVGMACAIQACQAVAATGHPNTMISTGTVQEEVGVRGATVAANYAKPDVVIVLEGPPADDTPGFNRHASQGAMGKGVQIRMQDPSAIMNPALSDLAVKVAEEEGIPYQVTVRSSGGTDARAFQLSGIGVPVIVLGVPARYIHSHNSIIDVNDYLAMVNLTMAMVQRLDQKQVDALTTFL
ncbi:M42 family metallopeptidase [Verrucomicrobiaceae bacterium 5K15]|uniref:M42 family metallopeptidase n=1 Tax=Oceaniferula flava TaxID=2800421 RepID=A0AAE2SDK0_9BACT|nr:M42 family metallopeptidase [Oceaniferula flavus]MBK1854361.1 M42 family metallopeptidase [Oceaniferula flavus]MBM1135667.1 M42 family metallopeptidase [Oceaniferula flavus]